jgi:hypothetical protein
MSNRGTLHIARTNGHVNFLGMETGEAILVGTRLVDGLGLPKPFPGSESLGIDQRAMQMWADVGIFVAVDGGCL